MTDQDQLDRAFAYDPRLRKARLYVEEHLDERITLEDVARAVALERKYFSFYFKEATGISFSNWLNKVRIEKAKSLLKRRPVSITEVAFRVGYSSLRTFQRAFKQHCGVSPSDWLRTKKTR